MSYSTRRFKPKTSKTLVRSSHSSLRPEVNVLKCPEVPLGSVALDEVEAKIPRAVTYKPRRSVGLKKKVSPLKSKSKPVPRSTVTGVQSGPSQTVPTEDFLEEMRAGLDEMGEKLKNVEKELTRQKIIGKSPSKPPLLANKNAGQKREGSAVYNPIDFTDMDFEAAASALEIENSFDDDISGESRKIASNPEIRSQFVPTNEAVESVIAKIRSDIKNWRISKGVEMNPNGDVEEPSVTSNKRGEIVVREEAERETPYESNRSSDGVTKVNTDSLSSDLSQRIKTKDPSSSPSEALKPKSQQSFRPNPEARSSFLKNASLGESSTTTLSNSIPMLRRKEPQYPLDKYLPRVPKRDDTFIKSRDIPLQKDVSLFRKIESLLKESQCMREPIVNCVIAPNEAPANVSAESSVSTEDLVAAEFYKATYGTPKKVDCSSKPKVTVAPPHKGAGDWIDVRSPHMCELAKPPNETDCHEGVVGMQLPWDAHHRVSAISPKTVQTETCFHRSIPHTYESFGHYKMPNEYGFNMGDNKDGKLSVSEIDKSHPKPKASEVCSFSSVPSVSIRTSASRLPYKSRTLKKVSVQNACINTDRVNTHVFSMKHPDPGVVDDFAGQSRVKACVVQELPKVNIRARLVQQSCGFVSINPVNVPSDVQNTAVVEVSHSNDLIEQPHDRYTSQPNRKIDCNNQNIQTNQPPQVEQCVNNPQPSSNNWFPEDERQPTFSHKLAFDMGRRRAPPQSLLPDQNTKPNIFDTVSHFKEQLSRDFNVGFEPIKKVTRPTW
uniref:Cysteine--tRNA ligase n=1 Tax=Lygus hesperus TaxID=30085 RepID=A0A0A9WH78_LYGHE